MKKHFFLLIVFIICTASVFAYESALLNKKEKVAAEAIPVTSADIINVAKIESFPGLYYIGAFLLLVYGVLIYFKFKSDIFKRWDKGLKNYAKFIPHIARVCLSITFFYISFQTPLALQIILTILGLAILTGLITKLTSIIAIILTGFCILEGYASLFISLPVISLLFILAVIQKNPLSFDQIFKIKNKRYKQLEQHIYSILRITLGFSFLSSALLTIADPKYSLILIDKINFLSTITMSPETLIFSVSLMHILIGAMLIIGLFKRFHALLSLSSSLIFFSLVTPQGLALLPLIGASTILIITPSQRFSIDRLLK